MFCHAGVASGEGARKLEDRLDLGLVGRGRFGQHCPEGSSRCVLEYLFHAPHRVVGVELVERDGLRLVLYEHSKAGVTGHPVRDGHAAMRLGVARVYGEGHRQVVTEPGPLGCVRVCSGADVELRREKRLDISIPHIYGGPHQGGSRGRVRTVAPAMLPGNGGVRRVSRLCGWGHFEEATKDGRPPSAVSVSRMRMHRSRRDDVCDVSMFSIEVEAAATDEARVASRASGGCSRSRL